MKDNLSFMADFKPLDQKERTVIECAQEALDAVPSMQDVFTHIPVNLLYSSPVT